MGAQEEPEGWAPPSVGVHFGYDNRQRSSLVGGQLRLPVLPSGEIELMGSANASFVNGFTDYQYNFEVVYVLDGRAGGLYGGGGLGLRSALFSTTGGRTTEMGYTGVLGIRLVGLGLIVPQIEYRWIFIDAASFTYQQLTFGASLALWPHVRSRR
jgi:hypothetical protein